MRFFTGASINVCESPAPGSHVEEDVAVVGVEEEAFLARLSLANRCVALDLHVGRGFSDGKLIDIDSVVAVGRDVNALDRVALVHRRKDMYALRLSGSSFQLVSVPTVMAPESTANDPSSGVA